MTIKQAKAELQALGMTLRYRDGEYRVAFREDGNDSERCALYTGDLTDAIGSAVAMRRDRS
jgi:hypothetical protein